MQKTHVTGVGGWLSKTAEYTRALASRKGKRDRPSLRKASHGQVTFKDGLSSTETWMKRSPSSSTLKTYPTCVAKYRHKVPECKSCCLRVR